MSSEVSDFLSSASGQRDKTKNLMAESAIRNHLNNIACMKKGQHSLTESVTLKAPEELLYLVTYYTPQIR